jgi:PAS domain S-box-containing protein
MLTVIAPSRERALEEALNFETLLATISTRFVNIPAEQVDREIEEALRLICTALGIDESTIYIREVGDPDTYVLSYVLRDPKLPPPPKHKFTASENFPWCNKKLIANEIIYLPDTQTAPPEAAIDKAMWKKFNVCSALVIPLGTGGKRPTGFWGIDSTTERREWPEAIQKRLKIIADVFANALERANSERQLRESEARLRLAARTTGAGFWTIEVASGAVWATGKLKEFFGLRPDLPLDLTKFLSIIHEEDRDAVQQTIDCLMGGREATVEYRIVLPNGSIRWVLSRGNPHQYVDGKPRILMGISLDVTERRATEEVLRTVSGRLLEAQEEERKRISRELHDSIGQQMAIITLGLGRLCSLTNSNADCAACTGRMTELQQETTKVAREIQSLSHELHSSSLDYLGLAAAINGFCSEFGKAHNADIHFEHKDVPRSLAPDVALALFRITQEGLHNALKYSGVTHFEVRLEGKRGQLELRICDSGAGFEVKKAAQRQGLGLISMRERALGLKGRFTIRSQPGCGTEILVRAPIITPGPAGS